MTPSRYVVQACAWLVLFAAAVEPASSRDVESPDLLAGVEQYFDDYLRLNPAFATFIGDHRYNDRLSIAIAPEHRQRSLALEQRALSWAKSLDPETLDADHRLTLELFIYGRRQTIEALGFPSHLMPIDHLQSLPVLLAMLGGGGSVQPFATIGDYDSWLLRLDVWPRWVDQAIANMREGLGSGMVLPWPIVQRTLPLLEGHVVDTPEKSVFWGPVARFPFSFSTEDRLRLERAYSNKILTVVVPGYRKLASFMRQDYLPNARTTVGMDGLPGGDKWYSLLVGFHTTLDLTPQQIHKIGKREVSNLVGEIKRLERQTGSAWASPDNGSRTSILSDYRRLRTIVEPRIPELFRTVPETDFDIRPVEPFRRASAPGASYLAGLVDGSRPGRFYVNADESTRGVASEALFLHEAIPGHHFQIALQRERSDLPRFRRFSTITAFAEGWALYAESLGEDLGLYRDHQQKLRSLQSELFRAKRLVVDTGLHAMGWSREQAIDYLGGAREVDRYIAWPGQALAYKMGELRIADLRRTAQKNLGRRFDLRTFHEVVLSEGSLPLGLLERRVVEWINADGELQ